MKKFKETAAYTAIKLTVEPLDKDLAKLIESVCKMAYHEGLNVGIDECMKIGVKK